MTDYQSFIASKRIVAQPAGFEPPALTAAMFPHQRDVTAFALRQGRAALFLDTGLGKSLCALEWSRCVAEHTGRPVLILTPLAVAAQFVREGERFGIDVRHVREDADCDGAAICVANYERLHLLRPERFAGVVLDESSILKSMMGATKRALVEAFRDHRFKLCCTATPAPNDYMELGNHAEFLAVMQSNEMLSRFFVNDTSTASQSWRLKGHGVSEFWSWIASWARCVSLPSDLGYDDAGYALPPLRLHQHMVATDPTLMRGDKLFRVPDMSATAIHREKRLTVDSRADALAAIVAAEPAEPWVLWCDTDYEADALAERITDAVEIRGSMPSATKEDRIVAFSEGRARSIITKPSLTGFGLNWQHCARVGFVGLSFSYESFYQAVRRCWRFGQARPVEVHIAMADTERATWDVVSRKAGDHDGMKAEMRAAMKRIAVTHETKTAYRPGEPMQLPAWLRRTA